MTTVLFLVSLVGAAIAAVVGLRVLTRKAAPPPDPTSGQVRRAEAELKSATLPAQGQLDALDTLPEGVPLAQLLADRTGPLVPPEALRRRAERLQARYIKTRAPEPMRALAKLLIDTMECGIPDAFRFHDAIRIFLATAPADVLAEFAPEAEARFDALAPWFEVDLSIAALQTARDRSPGPLDRLVEAAETQREASHVGKVDDLLARIGQASAQGLPAAGDALLLASAICKRPHLAPRAVSEMAMHPNDPVWTAAWMMMEARLLAEGELSNIPAFRSRVMRSLRSDDPGLAAEAAEAAQALIDADMAGDLSMLWRAVEGALARFSPPPVPLQSLATRLGLDTTGEEGEDDPDTGSNLSRDTDG
jgi:hypothetical protein